MKLELKSQTALDLAIELAQQFHSSGFRYIEAENKLKPDWETILAHPLSPGELVNLFLDSQKLIGVRFGKTTKYIMLDLDWSSKYHPTHDIDRYRQILHALEEIGLTRHIALQSSHSGGIHIYFPLPAAVGTFELAAAVRVALTDAGIEIKNGQLEIFPNTKQFAKLPGEYSHYKPHRLPLQPNSGSYLLEDDGLSPQPILDTTEAQLTAFLDQWFMAADGQDMTLLNRKLTQLYAKYLKRKNKLKYQSSEDKSAKAKKWEADLDLNIQIGWKNFGQTYNLMPKFLAKGVVFLHLTGEALHSWMYQSITTAPGYRQYCRHQYQMSLLVWSWIKTNDRTQYYTPYQSAPDRSQPFPFGDPKYKTKVKTPKQPHPANSKRAESAISRIKTAYESLTERIGTGVKIKIGEIRELMLEQIQKMYGVCCSNNTLNKYKNIWHPDRNQTKTIGPNEIEVNLPKPLLSEEISFGIDDERIDMKTPQTIIEKAIDHAQIPMIFSAPVGSLDALQPEQTALTNYTKHYNLLDNRVVTRPPGKFEVMGTALAKIAAVAALVVNMVAAAGIIEPEPTIAAEPIVNPVNAPVAKTNLPQDLPTHPLQVRPQANSEIDRSLEPTTRIESRYHNAAFPDVIADFTPSGVDRQEQIATASLPTQIPIEQTKAVNDRYSGRSQEPSSRLKPFSPIAKDNTRQCACPECELSTPLTELERWEMCRFCASKTLFKRTI